MSTQLLTRSSCALLQRFSLLAIVTTGMLIGSHTAYGQAIVKSLVSTSERMDLTVNTSRILTLEGKFSRAQVNNPEILTVTPLSPNELQISASKPGVTQLNLWDQDKRIYSVDVTVYGDIQELEATLLRLFPHSSVKAFRISNSLVLTGYVDQSSNVSTIMRLAEDYAPKIINNISVGGVQQILLHVKVMEISRTKLRNMGFDFANFNGSDFVVSSVSGLISAASSATGTATATGGETVAFGIVNSGNSFFGFLEALRQNNMMKILAEPKLVTISGRPASFNVGGEFPVLVPQSLGTVSIEYKKFGTQVDFMPLVLGNGNIRLEVRPRVSEIDNTRSVVVNNFTIPGLRVREVDTGVEMKAGQTLALAGLIQNRVETQNRGIPLLADLPWIGAAFRRVHEENNEIELLILVRPELVDALDPHEVPPCGPGMGTQSPTDYELYLQGHTEVPACNGCSGVGCENCRQAQGAEENSTTVEEVPSIPVVPNNLDPQAKDVFPGQRFPQVFPSKKLRLPSQQVSPRSPVPSRGLAQPSRTPAVRPRAVALPTRSNSYNRTPGSRQRVISTAKPTGNGPGLIGPVGYDLQK